MRRRHGVARLMTGLSMICLTTCAVAQSGTIWEIGKNDGSAREFPPDARPHVVYEIGKSNWSTAWSGTQEPGAPYEIDFSLGGGASAEHSVLHMSIQTATPVVPALRVEVNGREGLFFLHPALTRSAAEPDPVPLAQLNIDIPTGFLHSGANRIVLWCVDLRSTDSKPLSTPSIRYDYLSLTTEKGAVPPAVTAELWPTIFYVERGGKLFEIVDATLRSSGPAPEGTAVLRLNGRETRVHLPAIQQFGEQQVEFEVPEWTGAAQARLTVEGRRRAQFAFTVEPARKWKLFVVPHTHLDVGYTDFQGKVAEVQAQALQDAIELIHEHPDFRFATDGSWNVQQFLRTRPGELQKELAALAKAGKIGIPADYANLLTGYASLETLYRSLYYSKSLAATMGIPFEYATATDVPSHTAAYPSVLASAGVHYLAIGGNGDRGPVLQHGPWDKKSPFWWQSSDGEKVLTWYARGYAQIAAVFGLPPEVEGGRGALPLFLSAYDRSDYKPDAVLVYGAQSENTQIEPLLAGFAAEWSSRYAYPKLQYATFADFFRYIDKHYGSTLETYKGDMGPYWEDGVASDAAHTAQDRMNQNRALSVDIVSTAAHELGHGYLPPKAELDQAWGNIELYSEHTWTGGMSVTQPHMDRVIDELAVKDNYAVQARFQLADIAGRSMGALADQIHAPAPTLVIFNGLNWKRDVLVESDVRKNEHLIDLSTGREIPAEVLWRREGFTRARFIVRDVPPVGYKCVQFKTGDTDIPMNAPIDMSPTIENQFYRVTVDPDTGSIRSIFDKQLGREIVDQNSPYRFGQYLYVTGGDGATRIIHSDPRLPLPDLAIHTAGGGKYLGTKKTPWGHAIHLESSDTNARSIGLEILLFDSEKKIELNYTVDKQLTYAKEGVYIAFPVAAAKPQFAYEIQQGWVNPAVDLMKGGSGEWFTVQHWMAAHDDDLAVAVVPLDAPLATFGDIVRGEWPGEFHPKSSTIFSYPMSNYWHTNYQAGQGGMLSFRYVLTSSRDFSPAAFSKLGWESMEPVELNRIIPPDKIGNPPRPLPAEGTSLLDVTGENVVLADWKLAEDGNGTIVRLAETAGGRTEATIHFPRERLRAAVLCNSVEDNERNLEVEANSVHITLNPHEVVTVRLNTDEAH